MKELKRIRLQWQAWTQWEINMKTFKEYISERISDAEKDDLERRKERHTRQAARNKENLKARTKRYKDSPN